MTGPLRAQLSAETREKGGRRPPRSAAAGPVCLLAALALALGAALAPFPPAAAGNAPAGNGGAAKGGGGRVIVIDQERLFNESRYGQAILAEIRALSQKLAAENRRIEQELEAEEKALAEKRKRMEPGEFRVLAEDFNTRVEKIRKEQAAKEQAILGRLNERRLKFFSDVGRLVLRLTKEVGADIVLDKRVTIYAVPAADMTDRLIALVDRELVPPPEEGHTAPVPPLPPAPGPAAPQAPALGGFSLGTPLSAPDAGSTAPPPRNAPPGPPSGGD